MYAIHKQVSEIRSSEGVTWDNVCMRLPIVDVDGTIEKTSQNQRRVKRSVDDEKVVPSSFDDFGIFDASDVDEIESQAR